MLTGNYIYTILYGLAAKTTASGFNHFNYIGVKNMLNHDLVEQCEGFKLVAIENGNCVYRGLTFDDNVVLLTVFNPVDKDFFNLSLDDVYNVFNINGYDGMTIGYATI